MDNASITAEVRGGGCRCGSGALTVFCEGYIAVGGLGSYRAVRCPQANRILLVNVAYRNFKKKLEDLLKLTWAITLHADADSDICRGLKEDGECLTGKLTGCKCKTILRRVL